MASKLTDLKTKTMERKQILEMLTGHCAGVASTKENGLVATKVYLDDLADELVNLFAIHNVVKSLPEWQIYQKAHELDEKEFEQWMYDNQ
jgi:hypothetical protein